MKIEVLAEVTACDVDRQTPALTYTITASDGRCVETDLCSEHAARVEALPGQFGHVEAERDREPGPEGKQVPPARVEVREAALTKAPPAKRTARHRPKITSLAEIEVKKKRPRPTS